MKVNVFIFLLNTANNLKSFKGFLMKYLIIILFTLLSNLLYSQNKNSIETLNADEIKVGNLKVKRYDAGKMSWDDAIIACEKIGEGWRLPTKQEMAVLYRKKAVIGGFEKDGYWSSFSIDGHLAFVQSFYKNINGPNAKHDLLFVRPVKSLSK